MRLRRMQNLPQQKREKLVVQQDYDKAQSEISINKNEDAAQNEMFKRLFSLPKDQKPKIVQIECEKNENIIWFKISQFQRILRNLKINLARKSKTRELVQKRIHNKNIKKQKIKQKKSEICCIKHFKYLYNNNIDMFYKTLQTSFNNQFDIYII